MSKQKRNLYYKNEVINIIYDTFTAANTSKGFFSYFDEFIRDDSSENVYLIKGGPGCGKSTFMKKVAAHFDGKGYTVERVHCSSDPDSLDGVKIYGLNTVIIDATSPHVFDMKYPGAVDSIIDLSRFWDNSKLKENKSEIITLFDEISSRYKSVYSNLKAAGTFLSQQCIESERNSDKEKVSALFKRIVKQNAFTPVGGEGSIKHRFFNTISCTGLTGFENTIGELCDNVIVIEDNICLSSALILKFSSFFKRSGYNVILFHNPLCPELSVNGLIVPQLKFGIFATGHIFSIDISENIVSKTINAKALINKDYYSVNKNKIAFRKKLINDILAKAVCDLKEIKTLHDDLEKFYIDAVDYDSLNKFTDDFISIINK